MGTGNEVMLCNLGFLLGPFRRVIVFPTRLQGPLVPEHVLLGGLPLEAPDLHSRVARQPSHGLIVPILLCGCMQADALTSCNWQGRVLQKALGK